MDTGFSVPIDKAKHVLFVLSISGNGSLNVCRHSPGFGKVLIPVMEDFGASVCVTVGHLTLFFGVVFFADAVNSTSLAEILKQHLPD